MWTMSKRLLVFYSGGVPNGAAGEGQRRGAGGTTGNSTFIPSLVLVACRLVFGGESGSVLLSFGLIYVPICCSDAERGRSYAVRARL